MVTMSARAPTRIDFTGAYTDVLPFCQRIVGHQVNLAIQLWATAQATLRHDGRCAIHLPDLGAEVIADDPAALAGKTPSALIETIVAALPPRRGAGLSLRVATQAPAGSGLGGSGAVGVAVVGVLRALRREPMDRTAIANQAADLERHAGSLGGRQDQFAAALGGAHHFQFLGAAAIADRLDLGREVAKAIDQRFLLAHPGGTRDSSDLVADVIGRHAAGDRATTAALHALNDLGPDIGAAIEDDDPNAFIEIVREVARAQRSLSPIIGSTALAQLQQALGAAAEFVKPTGSGGSGNCLLICHQPDRRQLAIGQLRRMGFTRLPINVDHDGLVVREGALNGGSRP